MDKTERLKNISNPESTEIPESKRSPRVPLGKAGWALLIYAILAALCYCFLHPALFVRTGDWAYHLPGIGVTITQFACVACILVCFGKQIHHSTGGWICLGCALALGLCFMLYGNNVLRLLNLPLLIGTTFLGLYTLAGHMTHSPLTARGLHEGLLRFFPGLFRHWCAPFKAMTFNKKSRALQGLGLGLVICVPVVAIVIALLSSADSVFGDMMQHFVRLFTRIDGIFIWKLMKTLVLALCIFSLWYALTQEKQALKPAGEKPHVPALSFTLVLGVLSMVYMLFVYVQLRYLFGGQETAVMEGYASYARSGFFQLVWVSLITLLLVLPALTLCPQSKVLRIFAALSMLLTLVILISALYRMRLYILVYGLSLLRLMTLWAIAVIFLALVLTLCKCLRPQFKVCPALLTAALCSWALLNLLNADLTIARYNVRACNQGRIQELDTRYLTQDLSPDVLPALYEIEDEDLRATALQQAANAWTGTAPAPYDTSLGYMRYGRALENQASFSVLVTNQTGKTWAALSLDFETEGASGSQGVLHADGSLIQPDEEITFTFTTQDFASLPLPEQLHITLTAEDENGQVFQSNPYTLYFPCFGWVERLTLKCAEDGSLSLAYFWE